MEQSAGGVVIGRTADATPVLALVQSVSGSWALPKGHLEPGETLEQAALREVHEETGLDPGNLLFVSYLGSWDFNEHSPDVPKINHFFLLSWTGGALPVLSTDSDHRQAAWWRLPLQDVELSYQYQQELVETLTFGQPACIDKQEAG
jgi:8-oxo-dGTP pyrophosphatase MutT (NUDIX family)